MKIRQGFVPAYRPAYNKDKNIDIYKPSSKEIKKVDSTVGLSKSNELLRKIVALATK
jgi:hypothetical protein